MSRINFSCSAVPLTYSFFVGDVSCAVLRALASFALASPANDPARFFPSISRTTFAASDANDAFNLTAFLANFKDESKSDADCALDSFSSAIAMHRDPSSAFILVVVVVVVVVVVPPPLFDYRPLSQ